MQQVPGSGPGDPAPTEWAALELPGGVSKFCRARLHGRRGDMTTNTVLSSAGYLQVGNRLRPTLRPWMKTMLGQTSHRQPHGTP